jgi:hypothetical protein
VSVKNFRVEHCTIQDIREFIETHHYSGTVNGLRISHCFALYDSSTLIGAMIYGSLGMANAYKKYAENESDVVELRRLACIDDTPKNTESYFIGYTIRWLKKNTDYTVIVSYADTHYGHEGIIYKASNFTHIGMTQKSRVIQFGDRQYHDKCIRTYYTNKEGVKALKPFAQRVKDALDDGSAYYVTRPPKHIYMFRLKKERDNATNKQG